MASFLCEAKKPNKQKKRVVFLVEGSRPTLDGGGRSGPTLEGRKKEGIGEARTTQLSLASQGARQRCKTRQTCVAGAFVFSPKAMPICIGVQFMGPHVYCMYAILSC